LDHSGYRRRGGADPEPTFLGDRNMAHPTHPGMTLNQLQARLIQLGEMEAAAVEERHQICEELMGRIERQREALVTVKINGMRDGFTPALEAYIDEQTRK
jgi:hypothetical protein